MWGAIGGLVQKYAPKLIGLGQRFLSQSTIGRGAMKVVNNLHQVLKKPVVRDIINTVKNLAD